MSILAKNQWLRKFGAFATALVATVTFAACGSRDQEQKEPASTAVNTTAVDTTHPQHVASDSTLQKVQEISVAITGNNLPEMRFSTDTILIRAGALVKIKLENKGSEQSVIHNLVITGNGNYREAGLEGARIGSPGNYVPKKIFVLAATSLALPGQTVELEFQAPLTPATFDFVCTYPDHYQQEHGKLLVE